VKCFYVIDLGNTNLTLGLYQGETLRLHWRLATDQARMPDEYGIQILSMLEHGGCKPEELTGICLSSVVPPSPNASSQPPDPTCSACRW